MTHKKFHIDNFKGLFMGLAIGDALGAPLEFQPSREPNEYIRKYMTGGAHNVTKGEFTDDTSMALAIADAFLQKKEFAPSLILENFLAWKNEGKFSPRGVMFDCGNTVFRALSHYEGDKSTPFVGDTDPDTAGNGGLMRLAPCILAAKDEENAVKNAVKSTRLTHGAPEALLLSEIFAKELWRGEPVKQGDEFRLPTDIKRQKVMSGGYVKETYQVSWWAVQTTNTFEDAIIKSINRGYDSDTSGAVTGMLAGRIYGLSAIPKWMIDGLQWNSKLMEIAEQLIEL